MELVELKIHGISYSDNTSGAFAIILDEVNGNKKLPIVIGSYEAQSIAIALEKKIKTSRPLTHELFKGFADKFNISLNHIVIHKLSDGVFYSNMVCEKDSEVVKVDSRTSDAIAVSIRFNAPIFVTKEKLNVINSIIGLAPTIVEPTPTPEKPASEIGVSITLLSPNSSNIPFEAL